MKLSKRGLETFKVFTRQFTPHPTETIWYTDVLQRGFYEELCSDGVYEDQYGFEYTIICLEYNDLLYIYWNKETQLCYVATCRGHDITHRQPVHTLLQLDILLHHLKTMSIRKLLKKYKKHKIGLEVLLDKLKEANHRAALVQNVDGKWALLFGGLQTNYDGKNVDISSHILTSQHAYFKDTIREAVLFHLTP